MGLAMLDGTDITPRSAWLADMLARTTGEAVWVGELAHGKVHVVHQAAPPDNPVQILDVDNAIPWHPCVLGHAIVAGLDTHAQEVLHAATLGEAGSRHPCSTPRGGRSARSEPSSGRCRAERICGTWPLSRQFLL